MVRIVNPNPEGTPTKVSQTQTHAMRTHKNLVPFLSFPTANTQKREYNSSPAQKQTPSMTAKSKPPE